MVFVWLFVYIMAEGRSPFRGFEKKDMEESTELKEKFGQVRVQRIEETLEKLAERVRVLEMEKVMWGKDTEKLRSELKEVKKQKDELREENESLKRNLRQEMLEVRKCNENMQQTVVDVEKKQEEWVKKNERAEQSIKEIMEQQKKENDGIERKIVSVIKEKKKLVRDTVDKVKCVMIYGLKEEKIDNRLEREEKEKEKIRQVIAEIVDDEEQALSAVEEYHRLGKFEENKGRPLRIKFATQAQAEEIINGAWKLAGKDKFRKIWINRDLDMKERETLKGLVAEAKEKNELRTEEEKTKFYWKVLDLKLRRRNYRR